MVVGKKLFNGQKTDNNPNKETRRPTRESQKGIEHEQSSVREIKTDEMFSIQFYREGK